MITLTEQEKAYIAAYYAEGFNPFLLDDNTRAGGVSLLQKADDLCYTLDAYDEVGDSLMEWFMEKCRKEGLV